MVPPQAESGKTFISYARREDSAFALKLAKELRQAGANIWLDTLDIAPGKPWDPSVEQALSDCPRLLVIVTPASISSESVMGETLYALIAGKTVIPVLYQECKFASRMRRLQCVDFIGDYQSGLVELLKTLGIKRGSTPVIEQVPKSAQGVEARRLRVFLCHGSGDKPAIREMYVRLQQDGFEPWLDEEDLLPGQDWQVEIPKAVRAADVVLVCLSPHAVNKAGYVQKEIKFALDAADEKPEGAIFIIPVKLEECAVPERLGRWHWVDFSSVKGYEKVVRVLRLRAASLGLDTTPPTKTARPFKTNPRDGLVYVWIQPGEFLMGATPGDDEASDEEKPRHPVRISRGFWLGKTPVTVAAYIRFAQETGRGMPDGPEFNPKWEKEDHPIIRVSWSESQAYCTWMGGRLPTEAQWEYAARGGKDGLTYPWGNEISPNRASYDVMYAPNTTAPVTKLPPQNDWGLHDLAGNVWEWVADWYDENYYATQASDRPTLDPRGPDEGEARALRGGAWSDDPRLLRTAVRDGVYPDFGLDNIGFRCAIDRMPLGPRPPTFKGI